MHTHKHRFLTSTTWKALLGLACLLPMATALHAQTPKYKGLNSGVMGHITFEGGAGVVTPLSKSQNYLDTGWNALAGVGYRYNQRLSLLAEWQFNRFGVPSNIAQNQAQVPGGNEHLWTVGIDPEFIYVKGSRFDGYVLGGGGFSRSLTSFTAPVAVPCGGYGYGYGYGGYGGYGGVCGGSVTVAHYSSNQGSLNAGSGVEFRFSPYERYKLFLEGRYVKVYNQRKGVPPGYYASYLPITIGLRW